MKRKDYLFYLIKSLNRTEKRYLKLHVKHAQGETIYLRLFDAIDQQDHYDEAALKVNFKGEKFIKHFHLAKRYLYDLILESLRNYHKQVSKKAMLNEWLKNVEILYQKGLYAHSERELEKAETLAREYEMETGQYDVLFWKRKLVQAQTPGDQAAISAIIGAQYQPIVDLEHIQMLWTDLLATCQPEKPSPTPSLQSKILQANIDFLRKLRSQEIGAGEQHLRDLLAELEKHPHRLRDDPSMWPSNLNNLLGTLTFEKKMDEALALIQNAKDFYRDLPQLDTPSIRLILRTYNIELEIYRDRQAIDLAKVAIGDIQSFLLAQGENVPPSYLLSFWFQFAYLYFLDQDYEQALHWINMVLNRKFADTRYDLQLFIRWLNLMVQLELQNYFVLRYNVDSMRRFIKKKADPFVYEQLLLRFFINISHLGESDFKAAFQKLHDQLLEERESMVAGRVLDYIDFLRWAKEKT